jgi:hypothetical protein
LSSCKASWKETATEFMTRTTVPLILIASVLALSSTGSVGAEQIVENTLAQSTDAITHVVSAGPSASLPR